MIKQENLNKLYDGVIKENNNLKTSELNQYGFYSRDIKKLMDEGVLKRVKRGHYQFISESDLYNYAMHLISVKNYVESKFCLEECYKINPRYKNICPCLFFNCIRNDDYLGAIKYFDVLFHTGNEFQMKDNNCYLYLLNMIIDLPEQYRDYANKIKFEDIEIAPNDKIKYSILNNQIRYALFHNRFKYANDLIDQISDECIQNSIIKTLIVGVMKEQERLKEHITILSKEKKYEDIVDYLESIQKRRYLNNTNKHYLFLSQELLEMKKTRRVPNPVDFPTESLFIAINSKNFQLALSIQDAYIQKKGILPEEDAFHILLTAVNNMIQEIKNEEMEKSNLEETELKQEIRFNTTNTTIIDIAGYLMDQDFGKAFPSIHKYLKEKEEEEYQFLIEDLIKISRINDDTDFITPITTLMYISLEKFRLNTMEYVIKFYESFEQDRFNEASIYLDIITKAKKLEQDAVLPPNINILLNDVSDILGDHNIGADSSQLVGYLQTLNKEDVLPKKYPTKRKK